MMNTLKILLLLIGLLCLPGLSEWTCMPASNALAGYQSESRAVPVFVSIAPQKFFIEQIAGSLAAVSVMVPQGASPATYEPKPSQMAALSKSKLYVAIGVPFERVWLNKIKSMNPAMQVVHMEKGIERMAMDTHHDHAHGAQHDNADPDALDPHIWLSPRRVKDMAQTVLNALTVALPDHQAALNRHYHDFLSELSALDMELKELFSDVRKQEFMVFHPSWGYIAQDYGLRQIPVELEGKDPKPADLARLIRSAQSKNINVIFAQPQFSSKSARVIAQALGGRVEFIDPLAENWMENLREVALKIRKSLR